MYFLTNSSRLSPEYLLENCLSSLTPLNCQLDVLHKKRSIRKSYEYLESDSAIYSSQRESGCIFTFSVRSTTPIGAGRCEGCPQECQRSRGNNHCQRWKRRSARLEQHGPHSDRNTGVTASHRQLLPGNGPCGHV